MKGPFGQVSCLLLLCLASLLASCSGESTEPKPPFTLEQLKDPENCKDCHPVHYESWSGSMHAYAADDPIFLAMNEKGQKEAGIHNFCVKCHSPLAIEPDDALVDRAKLAALPRSKRGVTCYYCHSIDQVEGQHNNPIRLAEDGVMRGHLSDAVPNKAHASAYSPLLDEKNLQSATACGACHDILNGHDVHLERTFKEWQESVFSTDVGATCAQCHMYGQDNRLVADGPNAPGVFLRTRHDHGFPGVDVALTPWPQMAEQRAGIEKLLDEKTLQNALCVTGIENRAPYLLAIVDNVGAGHKWPSGAAQDRRAWIEITAYQGGSVIFQSGAVPPGTEPTKLVDPDFWLIRDCSLDADGNEVHMFWEVKESDPNLIPVLATFDQTTREFFQMHQLQRFPRNPSSRLSAVPDRVTMSVWLQAFPLDAFDKLFEKPEDQGFTVEEVRAMRAGLAPFRVGPEIEWTADAMKGPSYQDPTTKLGVYCVSNAERFDFGADKTPAPKHRRCAP